MGAFSVLLLPSPVFSATTSCMHARALSQVNRGWGRGRLGTKEEGWRRGERPFEGQAGEEENAGGRPARDGGGGSKKGATFGDEGEMWGKKEGGRPKKSFTGGREAMGRGGISERGTVRRPWWTRTSYSFKLVPIVREGRKDVGKGRIEEWGRGGTSLSLGKREPAQISYIKGRR